MIINAAKMSTMISDTSTSIDPEAEVRKLQDLVRKLERQNQLLRNNQNEKDSEANVISQKVKLNSEAVQNKDKNISRTSNRPNVIVNSDRNSMTSDELDILDLVKSEPSDDQEDSWLYQSPKRSSSAEKQISPYKWVRQEFEHPSPEVETARRVLLEKLDEVAKGNQSPSSGASSLCSPTSTSGTLVSSDGSSMSQLPNSISSPAIRQPLVGLGSRVNTNTITRKKPGAERSLLQHLQASPRHSPQGSPRSMSPRNSPDQDVLRRARDEYDGANNNTCSSSSEDLASSHKLADVVDVQVLARMQEESLRQSLNSPYTSPRKTSRAGHKPVASFSLGENEDSSTSQHSSNRSSPGRMDSEGYQQTRQSNNSLASAGSSQSSSPPESPYGSQYLDQNRQALDTHRRSMPNLVTRNAQPGIRSHPSDSRLGSKLTPNRTKGTSPSRMARPSQPVTNHLQPRHQSPGRTLSPQRSGIPNPRSTGIPRPGSASKLPTPRKSSIPSPRKFSLQPTRGTDESWKDGCY